MDTLLSTIEVFCAAHDLSERQFGELALKDKNFVPQLRDKREPRRRTIERVHRFMATYRATSDARAA